MMRIACALLLMIFPTLAETPAESPDKKKPPPRQVRFLTLGDAPPFMQEVRNGVRYELEPAAGTIPPRAVVAGFGQKDKDSKEKPQPVPLNLGRISAPSSIPEGAGPLELRKKGESGDSKPWVTVQRPEHGNLLVLLWRDPRGKSWDLVDALVQPDGPAAVGPGGVMLLNLFPAPITSTFGVEKLPLPYGKVILKKPEAKKDLALEINAVAADGKTPGKRYLSTVLPISPAESTRVIVYRADGESPREPVKVLIVREPLAPVPDEQ